LVGAKNARNSTNVFKKLEKNTLEQSLEAKKGETKEENHSDLL